MKKFKENGDTYILNFFGKVLKYLEDIEINVNK